MHGVLKKTAVACNMEKFKLLPFNVFMCIVKVCVCQSVNDNQAVAAAQRLLNMLTQNLSQGQQEQERKESSSLDQEMVWL